MRAHGNRWMFLVSLKGRMDVAQARPMGYNMVPQPRYWYHILIGSSWSVSTETCFRISYTNSRNVDETNPSAYRARIDDRRNYCTHHNGRCHTVDNPRDSCTTNCSILRWWWSPVVVCSVCIFFRGLFCIVCPRKIPGRKYHEYWNESVRISSEKRLPAELLHCTHNNSTCHK